MSVAEIREAIENITRVLTEEPEKALATGSVTATLESGLRFQLSGQNSNIGFTDMPVALGGKGSAPKPGWFLRAALASCNATVIAMRAAQLDIELKTLEITVTSDADTRGLLGIDESVSAGLVGWRTQVRIGAVGASPEQLRDIVYWAEAHSPVACTIRDARQTEVEIELV